MSSSQPQGDILPLFPLRTVLYPGMPLPLHIFEERYRLMIGECLEHDAPFGVSLIRKGAEVGGPAVTFDVGTSARIVQSSRREDGRMDLMCQGVRRFRIVETFQDRPYLRGRIVFLDEPAGDEADLFGPMVHAAFRDNVRLASGLRNEWVRDVRLPEEPGALSYAVAYLLDAHHSFKQMLLEAATTRSRLEHELRLLTQQNQTLRRRLEGQSPFFGAALN